MEKLRSFFIRPRLASVLLFLKLGLAPLALAVPKTVVAPAPPQPVEQKAAVKRGGSVDIPLKIYGTRAQTLSWNIKQPPLHGKLSGVRATGAESAVVTYRPPADLRVVSDRFTFSVRSSEGVSAPVEVAITITDDAPRISAIGELNFGALLIGASALKTLEFSNAGGGIAEGAMEVEAPWKLVGARDYKLAAGERRAAKVVFAPDRAGKFENEVKFTSQPETVVFLRGVAEDSLAVAPAELVLAQDAGRPLRAASFEIRNNTDAALEVAVSASPRLIVKKSLTLAAHETVVLTVQTAETDAAALEDTMEFSAGALTAHVAVRAKALPALVRARPESVLFRKGARQKETVTFENRGGVEAKVTLAISAPFSVEESGFLLMPGTEKEVAILLKSEPVNGAQGVLKVGVEGGGFELPVETVGSVLPVVASAPRRMPAANRTRPKAEEEPVLAQSGSFAATVDSVSAKSAKFRWQGAGPDGAEFRCFQQVLTTDEEGELESAFREYTACRFSRQDGANFATVENLEPGRSYLFRIDEVSAAGSTPVTFAQIRTPSPPARESLFSLVHVLFALAIAAGGVAIWQRVRSRSSHF